MCIFLCLRKFQYYKGLRVFFYTQQNIGIVHVYFLSACFSFVSPKVHNFADKNKKVINDEETILFNGDKPYATHIGL